MTDTQPKRGHIMLVDDSASVRALIGAKLRQQGYEVLDYATPVEAAERALASPPACVVTDLMMPGMSGAQLCRLLGGEPSTQGIPVVLLTAAGDRKSRYWARAAGAQAYVSKTDVDALLAVIPALVEEGARVLEGKKAAPTRSGHGVTVLERLSTHLDQALYTSTIAGEVRALSNSGDLEKLFGALASLLSEVLGYRWFALRLLETGMVFAHTSLADREHALAEVRTHFSLREDHNPHVLCDERASANGSAPAIARQITHGEGQVGELVVAPSGRAQSSEEASLVGLVAHELGAPLRMALLVEETKRLASTDALTGLLNRRSFTEILARERVRAARHQFQIGLLLLDVDHFKRVNDQHGHGAGDNVLVGVARVLEKIARNSDVCARWGGEEFVVALPQTNEAGARIAAERVRRAIFEATFVTPGGEPLKVTASVGIASAEAPWTLEELISRSDQAMYLAKARGRNRVESSVPVGSEARILAAKAKGPAT